MNALTIDFKHYTKEKEIHQFLNYLAKCIGEKIHYTIEYKAKNNIPHIHGVTNCKQTTLLHYLKHIFLGFNFNVKNVYDIDNWLNYITKESNEIHETNSANKWTMK